MNPANKISVVEFTRTANFADIRNKEILDFLQSIDRLVFETEDVPGFVLNALLFPFLNRAIYLVQASKMSPKDVDEIMLRVCGHKLGPLATIDLIGLDVCLAILEVLHDGFGNPKYAPCPLLVNMVTAGKKGVKSGEGFYSWNHGTKDLIVAPNFKK
jgi:3-hydroxybutyryl-CoA dehydrogenase